MPSKSRRTPFLKTHEVAEQLGVSVITIYNWLKTGRIPEPQRHPATGYRQWTVADVEVIREMTRRPGAAA
ncbi:MAG TPA: MerR family DNA-binding transcriptional regulator [Bryobacteraceae bacterium]|nr:MerR family DNA-binding transcriptional regulator [Bryobacteraceae bacterium]